MNTCPVCGARIDRGGRRSGPLPTYCSKDCKNQARRERERRNGVAERRAQAARARAEAERAQRPTRPCPYCGDPMGNVRRKQCGKPECKRRHKADRMREYMRKRRADSELARKHREYDRRSHLKRLKTLGHWRAIYPERAARTDALRRARLKAAAIQAETFTPRDVYERDGWVCQLCHQPIDPSVPWPDPYSPSVDHIVPLSQGGHHVLANVQAAHLGCNSRKCDRLDSAVLVGHGSGGAAGGV